MVVVGGGSMLNLLFLDQAMEVPPGEAFTKSRETLEGSKAGLLSRIPAHPRMDPRLWKTNLAVLSADTLLQRATVDMRTSVPSTTQASTGLRCETVPSCPGWKEPSVTWRPYISLWPCDGYCEAVSPTTLSDAHPICHLPHLGSRVVFHHCCAVYTLPIQPPETRHWDPIFAPFNCLPDPRPPHQMTAEQETSLVLFLVHLFAQPPISPSIPESPRAVAYHSLLLAACFKSFLCDTLHLRCCQLLVKLTRLSPWVKFG